MRRLVKDVTKRKKKFNLLTFIVLEDFFFMENAKDFRTIMLPRE